MQQFVRAKAAASDAAARAQTAGVRVPGGHDAVSRNSSAHNGGEKHGVMAVRPATTPSSAAVNVHSFPHHDPFDTDYEESTLTLSDYGSTAAPQDSLPPVAPPVQSHAETNKAAPLSIFHDDESYPSTASESVHEGDLPLEAPVSFSHQTVSDMDELHDTTPTRSRRPLYAPHDYRQRHIQSLVRDYQTRPDTQPPPQQAHSLFPVSELSEGDAASYELDYDLSDLRKMSYEQLAEESFDFDPSRPAHDQSDDPSPLLDRLHHALGQDPSHQHALLASLSLDEWEQAGQWFDEQFQHHMHRMRQARREKRAAAAAFETDIARRHDAVTRERLQLGAAMDKMRANGGLVLRDSTPKKASP